MKTWDKKTPAAAWVYGSKGAPSEATSAPKVESVVVTNVEPVKVPAPVEVPPQEKERSVQATCPKCGFGPFVTS